MRLHELNEGLDANQKRVGQVGGEESAKPTGPVLGAKQKQHPFKGRLVGEESEQGVAEGFGEYVPLAIFLGMIYTWYKNTKTKEPSFKVFINGKDVSNKVLTKAEAVHVIKNLAKQEHDTKTQYTIVDIKTNNIVFRKTWSDNPDLTGGSPSWVDSNESIEQGVAEANDEKIADRYDQDEWDEKVQRLKKLAGMGPLKTVWDPVKRVYKNVPVNQNPEEK